MAISSDEPEDSDSGIGKEAISEQASTNEPADLTEINLGLAAAFAESQGDERASLASNYVPETGMLIASKYKLVEKIGEGGMGTVWYAEQLVHLLFAARNWWSKGCWK